jgi:DNA-binding CsgD family transcriptional regulator
VPDRTSNTQTFADSRFGAEAMERLHDAFERSGNPMLISDDERRWVTGNGAACELLGIERADIPWRRMDEFTPPGERQRLVDQWDEFLGSGAAEGLYELYVPERGALPMEFSATAHVLPSRHLSVFISPSDELVGPREAWAPVKAERLGNWRLTPREREIVTLIAWGRQNGDIADRLFLSTETIKSHVHNALGKLGAHTRAHAVAIALMTGQISWEPSD